MEKFTYEAGVMPKKMVAKGKYEATLEDILKSKETKGVIKVNLDGVKAATAIQSFNRIIKNKYGDKLSAHKIDGEIYIEKV